MKIMTITLNPAFDMHCNMENFQLYKENYVKSHARCAGGKGVNISRGLSGFGVKNTAYCVLGRDNGGEFLEFLEKEGMDCEPIMTEGRIRENITLHSEGKETRISFEGFEAKKEILDEIYAKIEREREPETIVTFTGRLCRGIKKDNAKEFLKKIKGLGIKVVVDCNSFDTKDLLEIKPFLIKPNEQETAQLLSEEIKSTDDALKAAESLQARGVENVIISMGEKGFVFFGDEGGFKVEVPEITPVSTIGAGDSLIAGFVVGVAAKSGVEETLKLAAAFGTAACLTEGTTSPDKTDILDLKEKIIVHKD